MSQNDPNEQPAAEMIKRLFAQLDKDERIALISNLLVNESVPTAQDTPAQPESAYQPVMDRYDGPYEPEERDHNWRRAWGIVGMLIANDLLPMPRDVGDTDDVPGNRDERTTLDLALSVVADSLHWIEN